MIVIESYFNCFLASSSQEHVDSLHDIILFRILVFKSKRFEDNVSEFSEITSTEQALTTYRNTITRSKTTILECMIESKQVTPFVSSNRGPLYITMN